MPARKRKNEPENTNPPEATADLPTTTDEPQLLPAPVSDNVIDDVYEGIRAIARDAGLQMAIQTGKLLVDKFFGGDLDGWRERGQADASLRKLAERFEEDEVRGFSAPNLSRFIAVYELDQRVSVSTWKHLGLSHVRLVLPLGEGDQQRLLTLAEKHDWTVVRLEEEIAKVKKRKGSDGRGRPTLPMFVKSINKLERMVRADEDLFAGLDQVGELEEAEATRLYQAVTGMKLKCEELQKALEAKALG